MSDLPLLIEPKHLVEHLTDNDLLIVDLRSAEDCRQGHVPGAVNLEYPAIVYAEPPVGGLLPPLAQLSAVLSQIGLTAQHHVVAYDDEANGRASRLLWTLDALGHAHLSLLNGGWIAWTQEGHPVQIEVLNPKPSDYQAQLANPTAVADKAYIQSRLQQPDFLPLDSRTPAEYQGLDVRAARGGHIPGAVNLNWLEMIDHDRDLRFKPDAELRAILQTAGVSADKEVVAYCQTHHRSSHTYMVLKHLGYERIRGYHGAWSEWGNATDTPIET